MNELSEVLADETVIETVQQPTGDVLIWAEDCGPAPNAVEVFADHTDRIVEVLETDRDGEKAYEVRA